MDAAPYSLCSQKRCLSPVIRPIIPKLLPSELGRGNKDEAKQLLQMRYQMFFLLFEHTAGPTLSFRSGILHLRKSQTEPAGYMTENNRAPFPNFSLQLAGGMRHSRS